MCSSRALKLVLAQQNGTISAGWPLDHGLGGNATLRHFSLNGINIQCARRQMVDMRPPEADHIGNQAMGVMQVMIGLKCDCGIAVPAEGLQNLLHELIGLFFLKAARLLRLLDEGQSTGCNDVPARENICGLCPQFGILDQFQTQERGEEPEGVASQGLVINRAEGCGMHGNAATDRS